MKRDELRDQNKDKINEIDRDQIMDLLIARTINYESKNKDKDKKPKALNTESDSNKSNNKNKNKDKTKFNKPNKTSTPAKPNTEKSKAIKYNYCKRFHNSNC